MPKQKLKSTHQNCSTCALQNNEEKLVVKSDSINLAAIRNRIKQIAEACNLTERQAFDLQVAVGEAAANAIEHGSPQGSDNSVAVTVQCDRESMFITVKDEGKFKRRMPDPDMEKNNFRGRGIPLMLALMDRVTIDEAKDGTSVVLVKKINGLHKG